MLLAVDTETSGVDLRHSSRPFFVSTCDDRGEQAYWEWDVDPLTREVKTPPQDLDEIDALLKSADELHLQNAKFDVTALASVGLPRGEWPWDKTQDTLIAGHLLASNQPHDLTTMTLVYLGINIKPFEDALKAAVEESRRIVRVKYPDWRIARAGDEELPSVKDSGRGCDFWLPRAVAKFEGYSEDHPWWSVLRDYSLADTAATLALFQTMRDLLQERDLWEIYRERMRVIPAAYEMEEVGVTVSRERLDRLTREYQEESAEAARKCLSVASDFGYDLELPKSGNNKSLLEFCFGRTTEEPCDCVTSRIPRKPTCKRCEGSEVVKKTERWLDLPVVRKTASGKPSLDKSAMDVYSDVLEDGSPQKEFVESFRAKRKRDTALSYMEGYRRFWLPLGDGGDWYRMHPSLNPTGTDTLRWSSSNPNEQNISKTEGFNLRYAFGPAPGREWWSLDYENIELRIPAYESGEGAMIELFERPDDPPFFGSYHLLNASIVYPDLFWPLAEQKGAFKEKYNATWYKWCKNGGFAIQYGCQEKKADATFRREGAYRKIKESMPLVARLNDKYVEMANKFGYVETLPDVTVNPRRGYPIYCTRSAWGRASPTVPLNYHVQSTAMWCTMKAMIRVREYLKTLPGHHMIMQVHDEIVLDFPAGGRRNLPKVRRVQRLMMQSGEDVKIPLRVSVTYHPDNWSEGDDV